VIDGDARLLYESGNREKLAEKIILLLRDEPATAGANDFLPPHFNA